MAVSSAIFTSSSVKARLQLKAREIVLMPVSECAAVLDRAIGSTLQCLHVIPSRLFPHNLQDRRRCKGAPRG